MVVIEPITVASPLPLCASVRSLLRAYGSFLRDAGTQASFRFDKLEDEILTLPAVYSEDGGEVLAAIENGIAVGCIAYRNFPNDAHVQACELKRLFVNPAYRGARLGAQLVSTVLSRAQARGYRRAYLDTDPEAMATARHLYRKLGFEEYATLSSCSEGCLLYMRRAL